VTAATRTTAARTIERINWPVFNTRLAPIPMRTGFARQAAPSMSDRMQASALDEVRLGRSTTAFCESNFSDPRPSPHRRSGAGDVLINHC
jgi:hypothetical protein